MSAIRPFLLLAILALTAGCAVEKGATDAQIAATRYVSQEPPYIAVMSMVDNRDDRAAHSALVINASQRVIYDPAGTFEYDELAERGDVQYGATDRMVDYYERYHARYSHYVHVQKIEVTPEVAEAALRSAQAQGPSPKLFCTVDTVAVLKRVPGFEDLRSSFFPEVLREQIAAMPGVDNRYVVENDVAKAVPIN